MEQDLTGVNDANTMPDKAADMPNKLPNDIDEPGSAERAADLVREETTGPVPLGPATPDLGEDTVLFVETIEERDLSEDMFPADTEGFELSEETGGVLLPEEVVLAAELAGNEPMSAELSGPVQGTDFGPGLEQGTPWYQSRWMYIGIALVTAATAALGIGSYVFIRSRNRKKTLRNRALNVPRRATSTLGRARFQTIPAAQGRLSQLTGQLSGQTNKLTGQAGKLTGQTGKRNGRAGKLTGQASKLTDQASRLTGQAQNQWSRLTHAPQGAAANRKPLQQLTTLTDLAGEQMRALGATTRATTASTVGRTQASLSQMRQGAAARARSTKAGVKRGGKMARNLTLGATAGMLWSYLYAPQDGETTRQHLKQMLPPQLKKNGQ